ncbi:MAG: tyrosine-type recombinase/integrase [Gammaproteobacteria bacterium]|nr:tyrosine-type recombinase/integrase [Gammaproteobacteria bacterium]
MSALKPECCLESCLAESIHRFIQLRQLSGTNYHAQARLLLYFDRYLVAQKVTGSQLTRQIVEAYEKTLLRLLPRGRANRMCVVRQLCAYLSRDDPHTYVPESSRTPSSQASFVAYIYTEDEVRALLTAAARLTPLGALRGPTYQTLLGLLYTTGIRIGEAISLKLADFHRDDALLYIEKGKFRKSRWLPLSPSTGAALSHYVDCRRQTKPNTADAPLFLNQRGRCLQHCTVNHCWHGLLRKCGITCQAHNGPRLHDLRHSFAVHRLLAWYRDGKDINARLPWLATYMGHVDIRSTQVYLQPTTDLLEQVNGRFHRHYLQHVSTQGVTP